MIHLPQICLNFLDFFHRLCEKEILWGKRNFEDCKRIFEQAVVEALIERYFEGLTAIYRHILIICYLNARVGQNQRVKMLQKHT